MKVGDDNVMKDSDDNVPVSVPREIPKFIPLKDITHPDWIKVPLLTTLRSLRSNNGYYYNSY